MKYVIFVIIFYTILNHSFFQATVIEADEGREENDSRSIKSINNKSIDFQKSIECSDTMDFNVSTQIMQCLEG